MRPMADHATNTFAQSHDERNRPRQMVVLSLEKSTNGARPLTFGLCITQVSEILVSMPMIPVPVEPDFISGLLFWRAGSRDQFGLPHGDRFHFTYDDFRPNVVHYYSRSS